MYMCRGRRVTLKNIGVEAMGAEQTRVLKSISVHLFTILLVDYTSKYYLIRIIYM